MIGASRDGHEVGACPDDQACVFYQTVRRQPRMLVKYAPMHHYCRGGDYAECARYQAMHLGGQPSANLLPSGVIDSELTGEPNRVLVVDDTPVFLKLMEGLVAAHVPGATIVGRTSGADALSALRAGEFDLVVSDYHMPEMDGGELVAEIRGLASGGEVPVIIYTTEQNPDRREALLSSQKTRWVIKSPDRTDFGRAIRELLHEGRV